MTQLLTTHLASAEEFCKTKLSQPPAWLQTLLQTFGQSAVQILLESLGWTAPTLAAAPAGHDHVKAINIGTFKSLLLALLQKYQADLAQDVDTAAQAGLAALINSLGG